MTPDRSNNFNLLRLIFATLVLLSHASELIDGNRSREPLTRVFHTMSFGELAVDGFFILSGYLIVQSWQRRPRLFDFLKKRVLRIYPGFVVASFVSAFVVGPLGASPKEYFANFSAGRFLVRMVLLMQPGVPTVFAGLPHPGVNNSMWTISYEFRCYVLVAVLGMAGVLGRRRWCLALTVATLIGAVPETPFTRPLHSTVPDFEILMRLVSCFLCGACFYLYRDQIRYCGKYALIAMAILILFMFRWKSATLGVPTLGAYLLFWFAFARTPWLARFRSLPDVSYGVYLYGWPTQKLLIWYVPALGPASVFFATCGIAGFCGLMSWHLVEHPFLRLKGRARSPLLSHAVATG